MKTVLGTTKSGKCSVKLLAAILAVALTVVGCSSNQPEGALPSPLSLPSSDGTVASTVPSTTEPTSSTVESADRGEPSSTADTPEPTTDDVPIEVLLADQIRGYFDARADANAAPVPNPDDSRLAEFAVGEELASVVASTEARRDAGHAIRPGDAGLANVRVGFVDAGASGASAAACTVDDGVIYDLATDAVVNDDVVTHNYRIDLELHDGVWKLSRIVRVQQWEGVAGCALSSADYPF